MRRLPTLLAATGLLALGGCATVGQPFPADEVEGLTVGETTRAEVKERFGEPWRTGSEDGDPTWSYGHYQWSAFGASDMTDLVIRFDDDGVVRSFTYNTSD